MQVKPLFHILFFAAGSCFASNHTQVLDHRDNSAFMDSFIQSYELSQEGRYTHEYHPFLLKYTSQSLDQLEDYLTEAGLHLDGRMMIMGYEEQSMPQYYTNFEEERINDEASRKNNTGWSPKLHNRFGFMTGFLFKNLEKIRQARPGMIDETFLHIDAKKVHLFQDGAVILQEHAFGETLPFLIDSERYVLELLCKKDNHQPLLNALERFWQILSKGSFRVGNQQIAATQDVLFSIEYIKHLQRSTLPLRHFFTGPDITYPIEVTMRQGAGATRHAQHFVETFTKKLMPVDNESTVYIFCSFVDGVGKSTMLGNVKNWMRHGSDIAKYGNVDNSSSQLAEIFPFADKVFIADLPAQISHFTYKPDGKVFVDAGTEYDAQEFAAITDYVTLHKDEIFKNYKKDLAKVVALVERKGHFAPELTAASDPHAMFLNNVVLLGKKNNNRWIPFMYNGQPFLFKDNKPREIRCLMPLGHVRSEGLKNIETEQMLFSQGVRFPYNFSYFMKDLTDRLLAQGVKHVRFVDFLSMYPRSSRENIRINYLLQQMAHLFPGFSPNNSLYKDFVSGGELLHGLMQPEKCKLFTQAFMQEAVTRYALFKCLWTVAGDPLIGLTIEQLTKTLKQEIEENKPNETVLQTSIARKMAREQEHLNHIYGKSKAFVNIQLLELPQVVRFSRVLSDLFTQDIANDFYAYLWNPCGSVTMSTEQIVDGEQCNERENHTLEAANGLAVRPLFVLNTACKNENLLAPAIRMMRTCWYSQILNLLYADSMNAEGRIELSYYWYRGIPLQCVPLANQVEPFIAVVQPMFPAWESPNFKNTVRPIFKGFDFQPQAYKPEAYTKIEEVLYRRDWSAKNTNRGLFGFDNLLQATGQGFGQDDSINVVTPLVQKHHNESSVTTVLPTSDLWRLVRIDRWWDIDCQSVKRAAYANGLFEMWLTKCRAEGKQVKPAESWRKSIFVLTESRRQIAQLVVRLLATLEMVLKDPEADIVVRFGDHEDFKAAIQLIETLILPNYANAYVDGPLFDDYDSVEPYPSWTHWLNV
jgi:hypothetical protein